MANVRCLGCGRFAPDRANFCVSCGTNLRGESAVALAVDRSFSEESKSFLTEIDYIDATEIVSVIRRPDDQMVVDFGDVDPDTVIALLCKGLYMAVVGDMIGVEELEDEDEDDE